MMRRSILLTCTVLLVTTSCVQSICDSEKERHCFKFPEQNVDSTFNGVGEVVTPAPIVDEEEEDEPDIPTVPPIVDVEVEGTPKDDTIAAQPSTNATDRSSDGSGGRIHTGAIVGMAVGGTLLLLGAAVMRKRQQNDSDNSVEPSGENTV